MTDRDESLAGRRIVVTRPAGPGAEALAVPLEALGAQVVRFPTVELVDPPDRGPLLAAADDLAGFDWLLLTSPSAVERFATALEEVGGGLAQVRIACVGPTTAARVEERLGRTPDLVPAEGFSGTVLAEHLAASGLAGRRILHPRASAAPPTLRDALTAAGAEVVAPVAYVTAAPEVDSGPLVARLETGDVDAVTFASGSAAEHLAGLLGERAGELLGGTAVACLGPVTARVARGLGLRVDLVAGEATARGLVEALVAFLRR